MKILGIETSCDETAAAVVENGTKILSNVVASSLPFHAKTGGIIPEVAAREQVKAMVPVISAALQGTGYRVKGARLKNLISDPRSLIPNVDAISVTFGPGLIGSLLVGVETAKTLSYVWNKPLVPVNHLIGHLYASWLDHPEPPEFPLIALIVSGGHTELLYVTGHGKWRHLGGTRDDAAGEVLDKTARALGLGYPGGPAIEKAAEDGNPASFNLPRPLINSGDLDFSFSGLKTAVVNLVNQLTSPLSNQQINPTLPLCGRLPDQLISNLAAAIQEAVVDVLVQKTIQAAKKFKTNNIVLGGGVAANKHLREVMIASFQGKVYFSPPNLAVDNAAVPASAAFFNYHPVPWRKVAADAGILF